MDWENVKESCLRCTECPLCDTRTNVVFGQGNPKADVMFVGEGPGENEDIQALPFVGRSGKLLDSMLGEVGFFRESNIYIANIVKCRPPLNRDPFPEEQEKCIRWLRSQFLLIRPKIVVALGRIAASRIVDPCIKITRDHGKFVYKKGTWFMATLHPAAILRNPGHKEAVKHDLELLKNKLIDIQESLSCIVF
ncbi:MAG: uracil-DNA glycosylase [Oscillospiraceae bacterium]|nr:uracil-DNA glycosylase [Oscillospiraceae bacterium]